MHHDTGISCPDHHLFYYQFLDHIMGQALFDCQLMKGHFVHHFYKTSAGLSWGCFASCYTAAVKDCYEIIDMTKEDYCLILDIKGGFPPGEIDSLWNPVAELDKNEERIPKKVSYQFCCQGHGKERSFHVRYWIIETGNGCVCVCRWLYVADYLTC